jgi:hypothetical protein
MVVSRVVGRNLTLPERRSLSTPHGILIGSGVASVRRKLRVKLETHRVGRKRPARQPRPLDRALAVLDPLQQSPSLTVV